MPGLAYRHSVTREVDLIGRAPAVLLWPNCSTKQRRVRLLARLMSRTECRIAALSLSFRGGNRLSVKPQLDHLLHRSLGLNFGQFIESSQVIGASRRAECRHSTVCRLDQRVQSTAKWSRTSTTTVEGNDRE